MTAISPASTARTFLVAYDLASHSPSRPHLADAIMCLGEAWARPLDTVWMLRTRLSAGDIEAHLAPLLDDTDGLMIQESRGEAALVNSGLRWFRPRRSMALDALETAAVLAFPEASNDRGLERAA